MAKLALVFLNFALASLSAAVVVSDRVFGFVSDIVEDVYDGSTVRSRHADVLDAERRKVARLAADLDARTEELDAERRNTARLKTELDTERRKTVELSTELDRARATNQDLTTRMTEIERDLKAERAKYDELDLRTRTKAADDADYYRKKAAGLRVRGQRMATANVTATAAEAIPFFGVAVMAAATAYEIAETCAMMQEMDDLASVFDNRPVDETTTKVCGTDVQSATEVWHSMAAAPTAAWEEVQVHLAEVTRKLPEIPELPNLDWSWFWSWVDELMSLLPNVEDWLPE